MSDKEQLAKLGIALEAKTIERLQIKFVCEDGLEPVKAHEDDAGYDLKASKDVLLRKGITMLIPTGLQLILPRGYEAEIRPRSGISKRGIDTSIGTIDAGYIGQIHVMLTSRDEEPVRITKGQRIAQMIINQLPAVELVRSWEAIEKTARGENGFGSSGE